LPIFEDSSQIYRVRINHLCG